MLKLMIADDERVIRETISSLIDWHKIGVELVGLCKDGIEAYNMILDESPDIVMTDIRMPGLSGLDLVREISGTDQQIQFIILSGYEDFEYAREAMKYGIRHYLLKPCNEEKIMESVLQAGEDCLRIRRQQQEKEQQSLMWRTVRQDAIYHMLMDGIGLEKMETEERSLTDRLTGPGDFYGQYVDLYQQPCYLNYVYFLELKYLEPVLERLRAMEEEQKKQNIFYGVYVNNTLLLFSYEHLKTDLEERCALAAPLVQVEERSYPNLLELLQTVLLKIRRYDTVYAVHNYKPIAVMNHQNLLQHVQNICRQLEGAGEETVKKLCCELRLMVESASQEDFLKMMGSSVCIRLPALGGCSRSEVTELLQGIQQAQDIQDLRSQILYVVDRLEEDLCRTSPNYGVLVEKVMAYVQEHLGDQDLTLKKIAEQYLYMNVDYVSRQFRRSTGEKFSQFLTAQRVKRAKELLMNADTGKIQYVAQQVGCGNNPQYFSQIFKKQVGMTPGRWAAQMQNKES